MATVASKSHFLNTSGENDSVWVHKEPYSNRPHFEPLTEDLTTDVCVIGSGIAGVSVSYELVTRGVKVVMLEARDILSGESGRTSGHLNSGLDSGFVELASKRGQEAAQLAVDSHTYAINRVGEISKELGIDCEYRQMPGYDISQYERGTDGHAEEVEEFKEEVKKMKELGMTAEYLEGYAIKGWDGKVDQRDVVKYEGQATFHPTKYILGILKWLAQQPNFQCYARTRVMSIDEKGLLNKNVKIGTDGGQTVTCANAVEATCVPLQKLSVIAEMSYYRTYCIAIRVPKGSIEDCLLYDSMDPYHYVRFTACDDKDDYLVIGGNDHKVGQEDEWDERYAELESWVRRRFTQAGSVDYKWSGQIFEPIDYTAFIGKNQGNSHIYIITGDFGNGLTHGVLAGKLIADEILGVNNPWSKIYNPKRIPPLSKMPDMISHDVEINTQYKRALQSDIKDIEDLVPGTGGVLNPATKKPMAVYKDDQGNVHKFSALCPHMKGVVCWNNDEKSWDCPVHGSRFGKDGLAICGPTTANMAPADEAGEALLKQGTAAA
ncbi:MAG: hypothetical protein L6R39_007312 [Caloplaca ligustica]|nr:MAG: hypothetical protein L6R39_007312 [Caloplaca ligustica]